MSKGRRERCGRTHNPEGAPRAEVQGEHEWEQMFLEGLRQKKGWCKTLNIYDPHESVNLSGKPTHQRMREGCSLHQTSQDDTGFDIAEFSFSGVVLLV